jgi:hypothetical protein
MITGNEIMKRFSNWEHSVRIARDLPCLLAGWIIISGCSLTNAAEPDRSSLQVGWASTDISPVGPARMRGGIDSTGSLDPITATALVLEQTGSSGKNDKLHDAVVLVSCDLQHITDGNRYAANMRDDVRALVTASIPELSDEQIVLMATHTHVAPSVQSDPKYNKFASGRIAAAVIQAWKGRAPGGVSYGLGHAVAGHNRIATYSDGRSRMSGSFQKGSTGNSKFIHIEGFEDHSVNLLYTWDREKKLTGVVANLACPAQVQRGDKISADYWHEVREFLSEEMGPEVALLPQLSAAGDIATTVMVERKGEKRMQRLRAPGNDNDRAQRRREIARRIAATISETLSVVKAEKDFSPTLLHAMTRFEVQEGFPKPVSGAPMFPIEIHAVRLGDVAFVTNPFEIYLDYGIRIKGRSPAVQTFVVELAGSASYLPTERAVRRGGYGAIEKTCVVGPEAGERIVAETLKLLNSHWDHQMRSKGSIQ